MAVERNALIAELVRLLDRDRVITRYEQLLVYECDGLTINKALPDVVVLPETTEEVASVVRLAAEWDVPFVARGAGTGLSGGALALEGGILLSLVKMDQILEIDPKNHRAVVQPGVVNEVLNRALRPLGLQYAPDPSSQQSCTLGGNVAENAGGPHTLKYGVTTNHVLGLTVVLPDGERVALGGRVIDPPGYDLVGLLVGSEGTLGIVTEIVVQLIPLPEAVETVLAVFDAVEDASQAVSAVIAQGIIPAAVEMMDRATLRAVEEYIHAGYPKDADAVLLIEVDGLREAVREQQRAVVALCEAHGAREVRVAASEEERTRLWLGRKRAFGAFGRLSPSYYTMDGVIPRSRLPEVLPQVYAIAASHGLGVANVVHAGDGNLHPILLFDERDEEQLQAALTAAREILRVCVSVGGTLSGEHGVGLEKVDLMPLVFSEADLEAMRRVKVLFDPKGRCNPGKILPGGAPLSMPLLRVPAAVRALERSP